MRKLLGIVFLFLVLIFVSVALFNTWTTSSRQIDVPATTDSLALGEEALSRLSVGLQIPNSDADADGRSVIYRWLEDFYPRLHSDVRISHQSVPTDSRLYRWEGRDPRLKPLLLLFPFSVPEPPLDEVPRWTYNPYLGKIAEGAIWGVGTRRGKAAAIAFIEAVEQLLADDFVPQRTLYWALLQTDVNDTIVSAQRMAKAFQINNIQPECIVQYGSMVADSMLLELPLSAALVGLAEKRELPMRIIASGANPEKQVADMTEAWRATPVPAPQYSHAATAFWDYLVPEMPFGMRMLFANRHLWFFSGRAQDRGNRDHVIGEWMNNHVEVIELSTNAKGQTIAEMVWHLQPEVDQAQVNRWLDGQGSGSMEIQQLAPLLPYSPVAATEGYGFNLLQTTIRQLDPQQRVIPAVELEATEARHFHALRAPTYYFAPLRYNADSYANLSDVDEQIAIVNYYDFIHFYYQLLKNS